VVHLVGVYRVPELGRGSTGHVVIIDRKHVDADFSIWERAEYATVNTGPSACLSARRRTRDAQRTNAGGKSSFGNETSRFICSRDNARPFLLAHGVRCRMIPPRLRKSSAYTNNKRLSAPAACPANVRKRRRLPFPTTRTHRFPPPPYLDGSSERTVVVIPLERRSGVSDGRRIPVDTTGSDKRGEPLVIGIASKNAAVINFVTTRATRRNNTRKTYTAPGRRPPRPLAVGSRLGSPDRCPDGRQGSRYRRKHVPRE